MGLGVRLKELSFHLAGKAALEPPQTWEKSCRREVEEASEGVDAGGPGLEEAIGLQAVPGATQAPFSCQREWMQRGKIPSFNAQTLTFSVSCNRKHHSKGSGPSRAQARGGTRRAVGCRVLGSGKEAAPLPEAAAAVYLWEAGHSDGKEKDRASNRPQPSLPLFRIDRKSVV